MKTVILTSCYNSVEASLIKGNLANEGIECFLSNENFTSLYPNMNAMGSGIHVFVDEKDAERAQQIINGGENAVRCLKCDSKNVKQMAKKFWWQKIGVLLLALVTFSPIGNMQAKYHCNECGNDFVI